VFHERRKTSYIGMRNRKGLGQEGDGG